MWYSLVLRKDVGGHDGLKMASIISAAAGQLRRAWPLFAASILTRFDRKVTLNWISLSNISHAFLIHDHGDAQLFHLGIQSRPSMYVPSNICINVPDAHTELALVWQTIASRTWTDHNSGM